MQEIKSHGPLGFSNPKGQKLTSNIFISWCTGTVSTVLTQNRFTHFTYKTRRDINKKWADLLFQRQVTSTAWKKCVSEWCTRVCDAIYTATLSFRPELFSHRNLESIFECLHRCPCRPNFGIHLPTLKDAAQMFGDDRMPVLQKCVRLSEVED